MTQEDIIRMAEGAGFIWETDHPAIVALAQLAYAAGAAIEQPRQWQGLTDEEIAEAANSVRWSNQYHADFARAIEAKLLEKNT